MDKAEDAEVRSRTSSTTKLAKNLSASVDMAEDTEVGEGDGGDNETVERLTLSKKSSGPMGYLTFLCSNADNAPFTKRWVSLDSFDYSWGSQLEALPKWLRAKFAGTINWTLIRSARSGSSLNTILYRLSSNNLWASVLFWMALAFWWHLRTKFSSAKSTPSPSYVNAGTRTKSRL